MAPKKLFSSADEALADISDGAAIMVGGWGAAGVPADLLRALSRRGLTGLTCITEACHSRDASVLDLVADGQVRRLATPISPSSSWPKEIEDKRRQGSLELETIPAGILAERIRAGGAGIGGFLVEPQADSTLDAGKDRQVLEGREYVLETPLKADFALLYANMADTLGNLAYRGLDRNWNPVMATAANLVVVQVDQIVEPGGLDPELVITPGIYVDRIVVQPSQSSANSQGPGLGPGWSPELMRERLEGVFHAAPDLREIGAGASSKGAPNKVYASAADAVADIFEGAVVMIDGFGGPGGLPHLLLLALRDGGAKQLTIVGNTAGVARVMDMSVPQGFQAIDQNILTENGQLKKAVASFPASPRPSQPTAFELAYRRGEIELESVPQGTLAERIRAGGTSIAAFYTPTGAGTPVAEGKPTRVIDGREYILEQALRADFAILRAHKADLLGNLVYRGTSRNFNAVMAPAADVTIVEVEQIVPVGELDPDAVVTPGIHVDRIIQRPPDFFPYEPEP